MKIAFTGIDLSEGKVKYGDPVLGQLIEKVNPKKTSPYFVEFLREGYDACDGVFVPRDKALDLLILDMERVETRIERARDDAERVLMERCQTQLENELPLCDLEFDDDELPMMREMAPASLKPTVLGDASATPDEIIPAVMKKAGFIFFYTAGPKEVRSWFVPAGADAVTCAGKIHSDLARGFIRAEIVTVADFLTVHNMNDARAKGLTRLVERDYVVREGEMLDIRFSV